MVTTVSTLIKTLTFVPLFFLTLLAPFGVLKETTAMGWQAAYKYIGPYTDAMYMASMVVLSVLNGGFKSDQIYDFIYSAAFFAFEKSLLGQNYYSLQAMLLQPPVEASMSQLMAECVIPASDGFGAISGSIAFTQIEGEKMNLSAMLEGLEEGEYGVAVHSEAVAENDCATVGDIFNPKDSYGELETIVATEENLGKKMSYDDDLASLFGDYSILGKSIVVSRDNETLACCTIKEVNATQ